MDWFEKAEANLCDQLNRGEITQKEFDSEWRSLRDEARSGAEEAAESAYNDYIGNC